MAKVKGLVNKGSKQGKDIVSLGECEEPLSEGGQCENRCHVVSAQQFSLLRKRLRAWINEFQARLPAPESVLSPNRSCFGVFRHYQ